ncbi:8421_t:CDS:2 [Ambispora gerdemannii]|uniref:8421_t:CDS:1 n=1 Tax=Ambispora gerdemannii TaxID=144530 RepID=A0A9N9G719_9GLOM|nr:8421_t:CDS:2 [Ambispora gerdemannii]
MIQPLTTASLSAPENSPSTISNANPPKINVDDNNNDPLARISMPTPQRIALATASGAFWGLIFGGYEGSKRSGLQYRAENAHKLPTTKGGWYFYHKRKNYKMLLGGFKRGARYAFFTGSLCLSFVGLEATLDRLRGEVDVLNTVVAGVGTALCFSTLCRLPRQSTKYAIFLGAGVGLCSGGIQEYRKMNIVSNT